MQQVKWAPVDTARQFTGHTTNRALSMFCMRWNRQHPAMLIMRRPGFVDMITLRAAIDAQAQQFTPGLQVRNAVARAITTNNKRRTGPTRYAAITKEHHS